MKTKRSFRHLYLLCLLLLLFGLSNTPAIALDTDIYEMNSIPNVAVLLDNSWSMDFGVYEHTVDYGGFYNEASELGDYDLIAGSTGGVGGTSNYFYAAGGPGTSPQYPRNEILLIKGNLGVSITVNGVTTTGDPGDPDYIWYVGSVVHTYTYIDRNGNLSDDGTHTPRITVDGDGYILLDGDRLPLDRDVLLHDWRPNPDNTMTDHGLGGQINAPGWYFSGMEEVTAGAHDQVEDGDANVYFFITGNWINMQMMYNLYTGSTVDEDDRTWRTRTYSNVEWTSVPLTGIESRNYPAVYGSGADQVWSLNAPSDNCQIKFHFNDLITESSNKDYVSLYRYDTSNPNLLAKLGGNLGSDIWFGPYDLEDNNEIHITFKTDTKNNNYKGFQLDRYEYLDDTLATSGYQMQRRIDVVQEACVYVIEMTRGKINWAFNHYSTNQLENWEPSVNPTTNDDASRENLVNKLENAEPEPDSESPIGGALQETFNHFEKKEHLLDSECSSNHCITLSDGYPSGDDNWERIDGLTFTDSDGDGWQSDPYQPPVVDNYTDDVAHYLYTHSFRDRSEVDEPTSSVNNITCHMLSFVQGLPLLEDAAMDGGGVYLAAYNKQQLINAFYAIALMIIESSSYVAPVISVDTSNKTQSGDQLYMAFFKPGVDRWTGNLKKYKLEKRVKNGCPDRTEEEWVVVDVNGDDAVDCDGEFIETSQSFWSTEDDGGEVERGGVGQVLKIALDASSLNDPYSYRNIKVLMNDGSTEDFLPGEFTNAQLGAADDSERYKIFNYVYGYTYDEDGSGDHYPVEKRYWPLGSMIHSNPTVIQYESSPYDADGNFKTFIVIGGNDGLLHVFDNDDGSEVVAYIPENQLIRLKLLNPSDITAPAPLFFLDGPPTYRYTFDAQGRIEPLQLLTGERRGGRAYYGLDISDPDPDNWTQEWLITNGTAGFAELGQSWSKIQLAKMKTAGGTITAAVFGGGYDPEEDNDPRGDDTMGRGIFIINPDDGSLVKNVAYSSTAGDPTETMTYAVVADPQVITDGHGYLTDIFFADLGGQIWKISYNNSTYTWSDPDRVFTSGGDRKMFYSPSVTLLGDCDYIDGSGDLRDYRTYMLFVGTGDREKPMETTIHNRIYGIVDAHTAGTPLTEADLLDVTDDELDVDSGATDAEKDALQALLRASAGWYIALDEIPDSENHLGEKILSEAVIFYGIAYFTSFTPYGDDPCDPRGDARVYGLNYCNGTAGLNYNPANDAGDDAAYDLTDRYRTIGQSIPSPVKIVIREGKVGAFVSVGGRLGGAGGGGSPNIPQPPLAIDMINWQERIGQ
ncbi:MAG: hypothetical protein JXO49_06005 [Deltaproteobacteria bacterium]|nr:hypothetical protein [Candidatus Anaeroferrophillus wilburensis]MBN2888880.1 hypothetical protein [Deltaproteobacteria bacterium]